MRRDGFRREFGWMQTAEGFCVPFFTDFSQRSAQPETLHPAWRADSFSGTVWEVRFLFRELAQTDFGLHFTHHFTHPKSRRKP